jgi:hypothetical protein
MDIHNLIWAVIYLVVVIGPIYVAVRRHVADINYYVSVISTWAIVFLPTVAQWYALKHQLVPDAMEAAVTMHILLTLMSCCNILIMFIVTYVIRSHFTPELRRQLVHPAALAYEVVLFCLALLTVVVGAANPEWFINKDAYEGHRFISWIWPPTVDSPMNYCRAFIGLLLFLSLLFPWENKKSDSATAME